MNKNPFKSNNSASREINLSLISYILLGKQILLQKIVKIFDLLLSIFRVKPLITSEKAHKVMSHDNNNDTKIVQIFSTREPIWQISLVTGYKLLLTDLKFL